MRIALGVEYQGQDFYGWQKQQGLHTVQGFIEQALSKIADHSIAVFCAGRTDAGVHATGQVVHFDTEAIRPLNAWVRGSNTHLPNTISIQWAKVVPYDFHARFSAEARYYRYLIYNKSVRSAIYSSSATWFYPYLDAVKMQEAADFLIGEHDFSSFRSAQCESSTPMRRVDFVRVKRFGDFVQVEIQANAFLHHMVRNIVGVLMRVGTGVADVEWTQALLAAKDRTQAAETAASTGLYLAGVRYPEHFELPGSSLETIIL